MEPNPVFTPEAVTAMDAMFAAMRGSTCLVERPVAGRSVGGAPLAGLYEPVGSAPCRVKGSGLQSTETLQAGRWGPSAAFEVRFPRDLEVTYGFRVQSDDRIQVNGDTLYVTAAPETQTWGWELSVSARSQQ